ncbi:UNVERIFIED_CONTAM: hypothetical protein RMT77_015711 [Armadillidium vulgare]
MNAMKLPIIVIVLLIHSCFTELGSKVHIDFFYFDSASFDSSLYRQEMNILNTLVLCSASCLERSDWCLVYCFDKSTKRCLLTNLMVSPYHKDSEERSVKCHTNLKPDLAFGSNVTSYGTISSFLPNGTEDVLANGIYNYASTQTCTGAGTDLNAYILFDLRKSYNIREIRITTQPGTNEQELPKGTEIKVGKIISGLKGDFSGYTRFSKLPTDAQEMKTYTLTKNPYVNGQYVSFQVSYERLNLALCYVQIFE